VREQANFWRCEGWFDHISPILPEKFSVVVGYSLSTPTNSKTWTFFFLGKKSYFEKEVEVRLFYLFRLIDHSIENNTVETCVRIFKYFPVIFDKSKLLGVAFTPSSYTTKVAQHP